MPTLLYYSSILDGSNTYYPGKVCSVIFLGGCPLRCPWCYVPALMTRNNSIPAQVKFFVDHFREHSDSEAACITGGEPLEQGDAVLELCKALKEEGVLVKLETSGFFPDALASVLPFVDRISFDYKTALDLDSYFKATGARGSPLTIITNVIRSLEAVKKSSGIFKEFRTTIVPGLNDRPEIVEAIASNIPFADSYVLQQFRSDLELNDGLYQGLPSTSKELLLSLAGIAKKHVKNVSVSTIDEGEMKV